MAEISVDIFWNDPFLVSSHVVSKSLGTSCSKSNSALILIQVADFIRYMLFMDSKKTAVKRAGMLIGSAAKRLEVILLILFC